MDISTYIKHIFDTFVSPGLLGGLFIGFSVYLISTGVAFGYKLIADIGNVEKYDND